MPNIPVKNTPYTPHGTKGLMTVPESSIVRAKFLGCNPKRLNSGAKVLPDNNRLKYCSPTKKLTPNAVKDAANTARLARVSRWDMADSRAGNTPKRATSHPSLVPKLPKSD